MTHLTHAISWERYIALAKAAAIQPRTQARQQHMRKEVAFLAEQFVRQLDEFGAALAARIRAADTRAKDAVGPVATFEHGFTYYGFDPNWSTMEAVKVTLSQPAEPAAAYLRRVVNANKGEPSRMWSGSCGTQFENALACMFEHGLLRVYLMSNLRLLPTFEVKDFKLQELSLERHDGDDHAKALRRELAAYMGPQCVLLPMPATAADTNTVSKALFRVLYRTYGFLLSGTAADAAHARQLVVDAVAETIQCMAGVKYTLLRL